MRFQVLGPIEVWRDGVRVEIRAARLRAALAALLVDAGAVSGVDTLLARVWPDDPLATAGGLQTLVSRLRRVLEPHGSVTGWQLIITVPPGYRLAATPDDVDALRFIRLLRSAQRQAAEGSAEAARSDVEAALSEWSGEPYADISAAFARDEAARLTELRLTAIELAAGLDLSLGRDSPILEQLPELVRAEPLREGLRSSLMLALYRAGRQGDALATYTDLRSRLATDLGVDPRRDVTTLYESILRQAPELDRSPAPPPVAVRARTRQSRQAMVGRDEEVAVLQQNLDDVRLGDPRTVVVTGEAGIGKSRLAEEFAGRLRLEGAAVVWGRCWEHEGVPALWPWVQALRALGSEFEADQVGAALTGRGIDAARLFPDSDTAPGPPPSPGEARIRLYDAVTACLEVLGRARLVVLVLEDLHWSDAESARLLEYVTATLTSSRVLIIATLRLPTDAASSPAEDLLPGLNRTGRSDRIDLAGLSVTDVRAYLSRALGRDVDEKTAQVIHTRTDGNPFFLTEVARASVAEDVTADPGATSAPPKTVVEMISHRLRRLPQEVRALLAVASVAGRSFDLPLLSAVTGLDDLQIESGVRTARATGILDSDPDTSGQYRFAHALVQETLLQQTLTARRLRLHARVGAALEIRYAADPGSHATELAHHWTAAGDAGDPAKAATYQLLAASQAQARWSFDQAEAHLRTALGLAMAMGDPDGRELELRARVQLGSLLSLTLGYNDAAVALEREQSLALCRRGYGTDDDFLSALYGTWGVALVSGDFTAAGELALEMADTAEERNSPLMAVAAHQSIGQVRWHQGRLTEALEHMRLAIPLADKHSSRIRLDLFLQHPAASARGWESAILAMRGDVEGSDAAAAAARATATELGDPFTSTFVEILDGWRCVWLDRPVDALRCGSIGVSQAQQHGFALLVGYGLPVLGWGQAMAGDTTGGIVNIRAAIEAFQALPGGHMFGHLMQWTLADCLRLSGSQAAALDALRTATIESDDTGECFVRSEIHRLRAELLHDRPDLFRQEIQSAVEIAAEQGAALFEQRARDAHERLSAG